MSTKPITFAIVIGAALTLILMISLAGASSPMVLETNLAPSGVVYEINPDAQGNLWVTDNGANEYPAGEPGHRRIHDLPRHEPCQRCPHGCLGQCVVD